MAEEPQKDISIATSEVEEISQCKRRIRFAVPVERVEKEFDAAYEEARGTLSIPGFRPGKAPRQVVEMRMGKTIREGVLSRMRQEALGQAILEHKLKMVSSPEFENIAYEKGQPFTFEATMEVVPDVTLPEYRGIKIERKEAADVTEEDVTAELDRLRGEFARMVLVEDRPVRDGDFAVISYDEEADAKTEKFERRLIEVREHTTLPGFAEKLRGMRPAEERKFELRIPEDYPDKEVAGKLINYRVELNEIRAMVPPEADEEFAKKVGAESIEQLRKNVHQMLTQRKEREAETDEVSQIMTYLLKNTDFDLPESVFKESMQRRARRRIDAAFRAGLSAEAVRKRKDEIIKDAGMEAYADLKVEIILSKIAEVEGIGVSDAEIEARLESIAAASKTDKNTLRKRYHDEQRMDDLRYDILQRKVVSFLHNSAIKE